MSVRVICSTFADLLDLARQDRFMWQLALTLHGISLPMPPIRETPEDIPAYHKVAVRDIAEGDYVVKYGEQIGVALCDIRVGDYVHVHNLRPLGQLH